MKKNKYIISLFAIMLGIIPIACTMFIGGPSYPETTIPVSTESISELNQQVQAAETEAAASGIITLTVTESQITSLLVSKLEAEPNPIIYNPQVFLQNGEIQVYGQAVMGTMKANIRVILTVTLDPDGTPILSISSADFGPLPAPDILKNQFSSFIDQAFTGSLGPAVTGIRIENITIANGLMTVSGRTK